jgi:hypothetical protein
VAVGYGDTVLTSSNGIDWNRQIIGLNDVLSSVAYGNGLFIAGSETGALWTSSTGGPWAQSTSLPGSVRGITFADGEFFAITTNGWFCRSTNGTNWTNEQLTTNGTLTGIAAHEGTFVITGEWPTSLRGRYFVLRPGETMWTTNETTNPLYAVSWAGGRFFIGGFGHLFSSTNGFVWEGATGSADFNSSFYGATFGISNYVVAGFSRPLERGIMFSQTMGFAGRIA